MDLHFDWIAVGSGASGFASALWAAHRGLKAIVTEKAPVVGGATGEAVQSGRNALANRYYGNETLKYRCRKDSSRRYRDGSVGPRGFPGAPLSAGELFDIFSNSSAFLV